MSIKKSNGVTPTEVILADLCDRSFLKLWSYPNPIKDDKDELCDLLVVFENSIFIFFDREKYFETNDNTDIQIKWNRWQRRVIEDQIRTANGAERYIRSNRPIFLDNDLSTPFPFNINLENIMTYKIIIAHGAMEACKNISDKNLYGSLAITYEDSNHSDLIKTNFLFHITLDKNNPVHVFDSHNLPIIFNELDTISDFKGYLDAKHQAINSYKFLSYCGEEDLLAHYFLNFDTSLSKHYIGSSDKNVDGILIGEGEWKDFSESAAYKRKKDADKISYLWDTIIQQTSENALSNKLLGDSTPLLGKSAIQEMAKEPRFSRRSLSEIIIKAINNFPESSQPIMRYLTFMPSYYENKGYVFLQLKFLNIIDYENEYRPRRAKMLEIACGAAKNKFDHLKTIVGIAVDSPKYTKDNSDDHIFLDCSEWSEDDKQYYEDLNKNFGFFQTPNMRSHHKNVSEFPE